MEIIGWATWIAAGPPQPVTFNNRRDTLQLSDPLCWRDLDCTWAH